MEINGVKYHYLGIISDNNIRTLQLGLIDGRNVEINVDEIFTFQKYKRFHKKYPFGYENSFVNKWIIWFCTWIL